MLAYIMLVLAIGAPVVLRAYGKRWLGSQTHPAALFILAWMASAFLLSSVDFITVSHGAVAFLWVLITFGGFAVAGVFQKKTQAGPDSKAGQPLD